MILVSTLYAIEGTITLLHYVDILYVTLCGLKVLLIKSIYYFFSYPKYSKSF